MSGTRKIAFQPRQTAATLFALATLTLAGTLLPHPAQAVIVTVLSVGRNNWGQLGLGNNTDTNIFTLTFNGAYQISAGLYHSAFITYGGSLYTTGYNLYGQLGDGTTTNRRNFTQITGFPNGTIIVNIWAGAWSSFAKDLSGNIYAWGYNSYGELGDGTNLNRTTPTVIPGIRNGVLAPGWYHTLYDPAGY